MSTPSIPPFTVISGSTVHQVLAGRERELIDLVEQAYLLHGSGGTTNPPSYFLRFPDKPSARIIALPASVRGDIGVDGLKWVSSYPDNLDLGIPRASAVLLLNDARTGYPYACLEGSIISAVRTAASAAVAVRHLSAGEGRPADVGFVGTGLIARYLHQYLGALGAFPGRVGVHDLSDVYARGFAEHVEQVSPDSEVRVHDSAQDLVSSYDTVVFATTAASPHVTDPSWFSHNPLVLHVSLRDLAPSVILSSTNVVDDVEHVLKADTSVHIAEQQTGRRDFLDATLHDAITGGFKPGTDRPVVFSPFGLGVLDLMVGDFVHQAAMKGGGEVTTVDDFFFDTDRHRSPGRA
ncbi:2,3-diaminopropionate biosynthesis protein SbnB [Nocardiopsis terrae]|uniref:Ornithine cyclodeaminase n=1 Tax=Nocardiopsis terrae TaxID=372655 RepID=A0ABR9HAC0_9ACTN|nr:2,3-diaminopropionate biosynthesis protein SbnB [Nocardiopsis terrae]MBE1455962.1 ornithine cyclodeaminase [Nocardiopsis terrae]GHC96484.1 2,3-diaminopropionate biosynthesis protein SbnB [Nocardiopsis terrae]